MKSWIIDAYRHNDSVCLWIKDEEKDYVIEQPFTTKTYIEQEAQPILEKHNISYKKVNKQHYTYDKSEVLEITIPHISKYETFIQWLETVTKHRIHLYNADIKPEQEFLYKNNLKPCTQIDPSTLKTTKEQATIPFKIATIELTTQDDIRKKKQSKITNITFNNIKLTGTEEEILLKFKQEWDVKDPDIIFIEYGFSKLAHLVSRLQHHNIECDFHRWHQTPITYKGGKSFYSYGNVKYQDYAIRLKGRLLIDTTTFVGCETQIDALVEMVHLSGTCLQQVASRSYGAVFQSALIRQMYQHNVLIPFKKKPIDKPLTLHEMIKSDRVGHTHDPEVGLHTNVAEIDFSSMYPWVMYNHNISADTILSKEEPKHQVPGIPVHISFARKGFVPKAIKPFIDKRMEYKKFPTQINKKKSAGLKWVLVSSYGYLRYREFKLGIPTSHMAIGAFSREILIESTKIAEENEYEVIHGIMDSLFIKKENINENEVKQVATKIEQFSGIPVSVEGIFKWVVFLPSINNSKQPLPCRYYGVFTNGSIKVRGIDLRQRNTPKIVKLFQKEVLEIFALCNNEKEIVAQLPYVYKRLRAYCNKIQKASAKTLACTVKIGKDEYKHNIPQKKILQEHKKKNITILPGQFTKFVYTTSGVKLVEEYKNNPDINEYKKRLIRSLYILIQPFGIKKEDIEQNIGQYRQCGLDEFTTYNITTRVIPTLKSYKSNKGLAERIIKQRLEKQGYTVWRAGSWNILQKDHIYPNVEKKYTLLHQLLEQHKPGSLQLLQHIQTAHKGMPDFICYKNKQFLFIECKYEHEQLSERQRRCLKELLKHGFDVEVHKLTQHHVKTRVAHTNLSNNKRTITERQLKIKPHY